MTVGDEVAIDDGVEGNARLTGMLGMVLLIALAIVGVTLLDVQAMFALHVFFGLFVMPVVCLKLATTGYRFYHYYRGTAAYRGKGPPHPILRIAAPLVTVATISLLASGAISLAVGPRRADTWLTIHQGSFIAWVALTTVHVLGHALETWKLTRAEVRADPPVPRRNTRFALLAGSLVVGLPSVSPHWGGRVRGKTDHNVAAATASESPATVDR